jgi:G3E family GTPase
VSPIPAVLVTGASSAAKAGFVRALLAARPANERWALLDNDGGDLSRDRADPQLPVATTGGCACCTGQVALRTGLVQLIRQSRPQRLIIAASGAADPVALERVLRDEHLARALQVTHRLCVATPGQLNGCPPHARERWRQQLRAADFVVATDDAAAHALGPMLAAFDIVDKRAIPAADALLALIPPPTMVGTTVA